MIRVTSLIMLALQTGLGLMWAWAGFGKLVAMMHFADEPARSYFGSFPLIAQLSVIAIELWAAAAFLAGRQRGAVLLGSGLCAAISIVLAIMPPVQGQSCGCGMSPADVTSAGLMQARLALIGAVHLLVFVLAVRSGRVEAPVKTRANTDPAGEDSQDPVTIPATAKVPNGKILGP